MRADSNASSRAVYRLGVLMSWRNRFREAVTLQRLYIRQEPRDLEGRVGLGRTLSYASRFGESIAQFDTVLAREADYRDAALGRAQALAWWGKLEESAAAYRSWIASHASDAEAELGLARSLAWGGKLDESLEVYARVAARSGQVREAEKGIARVTGWKGDLPASEAQWRDLTARYPDDPEVWVGLGTILRWEGRTFAARDALQHALAVKPDYDDARSQLRWVNADIDPGASLTLVRTSDSEHNDGMTLVLGADAPLGEEARWLARIMVRANNATIGTGHSITGRVGAQWQPGDGRLGFRVEGGSARVEASPSSSLGRGVGWAIPPAIFVGAFRARAQVTSRLVVSAGAAHDAFDDVVSTMHGGLSLATYDADATVSLPARVATGAFASASSVWGGGLESNSRSTAGAWLRWTVVRGVAVGATARTASWDHPAYGTYFAPQRFTVMEVNGHWERTVDLGLLAAADVGFGQQSVKFESDPASTRATPRGSLMVGWRAAPGREITLTGLLANVASAASVRDAEYRYSALTLAARFTR